MLVASRVHTALVLWQGASRHIKNFHQKYELPESRVRKACNACRTRKERCDGKSPCSSCERRGIYCSLSPDSAAQTMIQTNTLTPAAVIMDTKDAETSITGPVIQKYIDIYFRDFHPHWPFLHPSTFDASREPFILVQSVVMIGMWITGHLAKRDVALELHCRLSDAVRMQAESWSIPTSGSQQNTRALWPMATYQSILLQIIMALFLAKGNSSTDISLQHQLSADDSYTLVTLVRTCRASGMFHYPKMIEQHSPATPLAMIWVNVEEIKRFGLALYKVCRLSNLAVTAKRSGNTRQDLLGLADLNFCIPDSDRIWGAPAVMDEQDRQLLIALVERRDNSDQKAWISNATRILCDDQVDFEWA
ncbi:hypothetical protein AFCA_010861 [Aspergillus flavus]|nr:hypothetical protein AFCA_010861 [Aspergillus flavus]